MSPELDVGKAWQRLIREKFEQEDIKLPEPTNLSLGSAIVRTTTRSIAEKIILKYEWLGTLPNSCKRYYGIFFDDVLCGGVVCFSGSESLAGKEIATIFGIPPSGLTHLARGACVHWAPKGTASKLISIALKFERSLGFKVAIAYSDTDAGEVGTVYQATNWICLGQAKGSYYYLVHPKTGAKYNSRIRENIRYRAGKKGTTKNSDVDRWLLGRGWKTEPPNYKYRYVYILCKGIERKRVFASIQKRIVEYPKRAPVEGSSDQEEKGGSNPTRTLQPHKKAKKRKR